MVQKEKILEKIKLIRGEKITHAAILLLDAPYCPLVLCKIRLSQMLSKEQHL